MGQPKIKTVPVSYTCEISSIQSGGSGLGGALSTMHPWRHEFLIYSGHFNLFELTWYSWTAAICLSTVFSLFLATSLPFALYLLSTVFVSRTTIAFVLWLLVYFWLLRCRLFTLYISGYFATVCFNISTVYISGYFLAVCFIFLATAMLFVIVVSLLDQICGLIFR